MWHVARAAEEWLGGDEEGGRRVSRAWRGTGGQASAGRRGGGERTGLSVFLMVRLLSVFSTSSNLIYGSLVPLFLSIAISPVPSSRCSSNTPSNSFSCFVAARLTRSTAAAAASAFAAAATAPASRASRSPRASSRSQPAPMPVTTHPIDPGNYTILPGI